ncbi:MAG: response regulator, partial [Methanosarcinaceae archaeon]|nr:response regulator [Methanosarcinaceae archaeon]
MAHILVVEDDPLNMELAVKLVNMKGHGVAEAITGEEALDMVKGSDLDLILLDIMLPGIDGLEVL